MENVVEIKSLKKFYDEGKVKALNGIDLTFNFYNIFHKITTYSYLKASVGGNLTALYAG